MVRPSLRLSFVFLIGFLSAANLSLSAQQISHFRLPAAMSGRGFIAKPGADNSLKLDAAGNPVIAFWDDRASVKLAHCANPACTSGTSIHTVDTGEVLAEVSLALNGAGNPVISYFSGNLDARHGNLKIATCGDHNCSSGTVIATPDGGTGNNVTGLASSLVLDSVGNPVVSYTGLSGVKVLHCGNPTCTSGNSINFIDASAGTGYGTGNLALDAAGNPVLSYVASGATYHVKVAHCHDPDCAAAAINSIAQVGAANTDGTSLMLDAAGNPVLAYFNAGLEVAHCANPTCSANTVISSVDRRESNGNRSSLVLDSDGNPVISYTIMVKKGQQFEDHLAVLRCGDANCGGGNSLATPDLSPINGPLSSLQLDSRGRPVISYQRINNLLSPGLYVLHCANPACF